MQRGTPGRDCWNCGTPLRVTPGGAPSYCDLCEVFTGLGMPPSHIQGWVWRRADGGEVLELFVDHAEVHVPSPA